MKNVLLISGLVALDQITKYEATFLEKTIPITSFFRLETVKNTGIAFSIPVSPFIIIPLSVLMILFLLKLIKNPKTQKLEKIALGLILSGALGNLIDRIVRNHVIDFFSFWNFPIFNLADSFISIGILILIGFETQKHHPKN